MDEVKTGIKQVFWNADEERLRALFRIPAAVGLVLLALQIVFGGVQVFAEVASLPPPLANALLIALMAAVVVAVAWFVDRRYRHDMGMALDGRWWFQAVAGLVVGLGMVGVVVVALRVAGMARIADAYPASGAELVLGSGSPTRGLVYGLLFFAAVGTLEEILIRGYLLTNVAEGLSGYLDDRRSAVVAAIVGTALLFGLLHAANPGGTTLSFLNITLAGLFFGGVYAMTTSIAFPIGVHVAWNFALGPLFGLPVSGLRTDTAFIPVAVDGPNVVTGGSFGPEGGAVMLLALAFGVGAFVWWHRRRDGEIRIDERLATPDLWVHESPDS